jgi:hypothetical protein
MATTNRERDMPAVQIRMVPDFGEEGTVVLITMSADGLLTLLDILLDLRRGAGSSFKGEDGTTINFEIASERASVEFSNAAVVLRLTPERADEVAQKLAAMKNSPSPNHHYVGLDSPVQTLVLSKGEYPDIGISG